jgi:hypothetical protein
MSAVFEAYNYPVERIVEFYQRLNQVISYPDGMKTSLGILYWGRDEHLGEIEKAFPKLKDCNLLRFKDILEAVRTPRRSKLLSEQTGISMEILRILRHDFELWLPEAVLLRELGWFRGHPGYAERLAQSDLMDQLAVISAGKMPDQRERLAYRVDLVPSMIDEMVKACDFYRTGKNLEHIRAKIYYDMGLDTWQKWAEGTAETIIARFTAYMQEHPLENERMIPWPKEVRNGIEWAKLHLEVFSIQW